MENTMELSTQVRRFLEITDIPKALFCRKIGISQGTLTSLLEGNTNLTDRVITAAQDYINNKTKQLVELSK